MYLGGHDTSDGSNNRNRMIFWQPQLWWGCEYDNRNRNRGYFFFKNREYFKKFSYKKKFIYIC